MVELGFGNILYKKTCLEYVVKRFVSLFLFSSIFLFSSLFSSEPLTPESLKKIRYVPKITKETCWINDGTNIYEYEYGNKDVLFPTRLSPGMVVITAAGVAATVCEEAGRVAEVSDREKRKRQKKNLIWKVVAGAFTLAANLAVASAANRRSVPDVESPIMGLVNALYELENEKDISRVRLDQNRYDQDPVGLQKILLLPDARQRAEAVSKVFQEKKETTLFVQGLFDVLFGQSSVKIADLHEYFKDQIRNRYSVLQGQEVYKNIETFSPDDIEIYREVGDVATQIVCSVESSLGERNDDPVDVWRFIKLLASTHELAQKAKKSTVSREEFFEGLIDLVDQVHEYLQDEESLVAFEKMSENLSQLVGYSLEVRKEKIKTMLLSQADGKKVFEEAFLYIHLYLQEKITSIFSSLFGDLMGAGLACHGEALGA